MLRVMQGAREGHVVLGEAKGSVGVTTTGTCPATRSAARRTTFSNDHRTVLRGRAVLLGDPG